MTHPPFFFTESSLVLESFVELGEADARHLGVRRAKVGDAIAVGDGAGAVSDARITSITARKVRAEIMSVEVAPAPRPTLTVLQGLAKGAKVDWAIEKMVELGVDRVAVFFSGRSVPVWDEAGSRAAAARWERVAHAAAKQSRRAWLPVIQGPVSIRRATEMAGRAPVVLIGDPGAPAGLRKVLQGDGQDVMLIIGPEGGLEPAELESFAAAGAMRVGLGSQVLRTETAGLAMAAIVMFELGRLG